MPTALETNKYNHITATYFLLAERILREKQEKEVQTRSSSPSNIKAQFRQSWPMKIDMHQDIEDSLAASSICHAGGPQSPARSAESLLNGHRTKGLLELRRDESNAGASGAPAPVSGPPRAGATAPTPSTSSAKQRSCLFRVEEDEEEEEDPSPLSTQVILRRKAPSITNRLTSRKSAPVLNQIFEEEGESDDDFDMDEGLPPKLSRLKMNIAAAAAGSPGTTQKRYHRRKSQGRGSSCSSSETSDDDSESHRRRLDKDTGFTYSWNRRDSSEGPPGNSGGNGGGSSGGQSKPPGEGGSPPGGGGGGSSDNGGSGSSGGGGGKGQGSPSSCSNGSSNHSSSGSGSTRRHCASRSPGASELVESLKLLSLCLSSQLQHRGRSGGPGLAGGMGQFVIDPQNLSNSLSSSLSAGSVKTQERSSWKMCIGSNGSLDLELDTIALPTTAVNTPRSYTDQTAAALSELALATKENNKLNNLKNNVLQLPLCEKSISVNIQRSPREGLLCTSQASCCQVI
ncbi:SNF-related serine/threonine-protein kinase-like [Oncorhynchus clarkii lewisi]|uniref:SNF-related serine/threonine-protein kinase-like n=1 Tax=Oncorhynchus clarkii lewisi TaxID=490388 RepID=UPI0039B84C7F